MAWKNRFLDTASIRLSVANPPMQPRGIQRDQLARLLELMNRPNISVQVHPLEAGDQASLSGSFVLFSLAARAMDRDDVITPWHKSSFSNSGANCVEIARTRSGKVAVRDSKDPEGPVLTFRPDDWKGFCSEGSSRKL